MSDITFGQNQSPFDAIRHVDKYGSEFWLARELMPLLGYARWNEFHEVVKKGLLACQNTGYAIEDHFIRTMWTGDKDDYYDYCSSGASLTNNKPNKSSKKGSGALDYRLTRYGSYLTAMNGNPSKPEVAAAQSYFAIKTYEAEKVIPAQNEEITKLKLQLEVAQAQERAAAAQERTAIVQKQLVAGVQTLETIASGLGQLALGNPDAKVERIVEVERHVVVNNRGQVVHDHAGLSLTKMAQRLGMKSPKELRIWLISIGRLDLIEESKAIVTCNHVRTECIQEIERLWSQKKGTRQKLIGEWG